MRWKSHYKPTNLGTSSLGPSHHSTALLPNYAPLLQTTPSFTYEDFFRFSFFVNCTELLKECLYNMIRDIMLHN